jgi:hypothetical protein
MNYPIQIACLLNEVLRYRRSQPWMTDGVLHQGASGGRRQEGMLMATDADTTGGKPGYVVLRQSGEGRYELIGGPGGARAEPPELPARRRFEKPPAVSPDRARSTSPSFAASGASVSTGKCIEPHSQSTPGPLPPAPWTPPHEGSDRRQGGRHGGGRSSTR